MQLQLQQLRKKAGYASRASFAKAFGEAERRIKAWERGENKLSLEDACRLADFLHYSLDELAGRWEYVGRYGSGGSTPTTKHSTRQARTPPWPQSRAWRQQASKAKAMRRNLRLVQGGLAR